MHEEGGIGKDNHKDFDLPLLPKSAIIAMKNAVCAMDEYAKLSGTKWKKLTTAANEVDYTWQRTAHRALGDALACRAVWEYILTNQVN
jgi:DNA polymerase III epsilon subunit-like protein